jgi:predicted nuclease with RNAse H fold
VLLNLGMIQQGKREKGDHERLFPLSFALLKTLIIPSISNAELMRGGEALYEFHPKTAATATCCTSVKGSNGFAIAPAIPNWSD